MSVTTSRLGKTEYRSATTVHGQQIRTANGFNGFRLWILIFRTTACRKLCSIAALENQQPFIVETGDFCLNYEWDKLERKIVFEVLYLQLHRVRHANPTMRLLQTKKNYKLRFLLRPAHCFHGAEAATLALRMLGSAKAASSAAAQLLEALMKHPDVRSAEAFVEALQLIADSQQNRFFGFQLIFWSMIFFVLAFSFLWLFIS